MNLITRSLNKIKFSEFLIKEFNLFYYCWSKNVFLKYSWFNLKIDRLFKLLVICVPLLFGSKLKRYGGDSVLMIFEKRLNFLYQRLKLIDSKPNT